MSIAHHRLAAGAVLALALALPVTASAHPGIFTVTAKTAPNGVVYPNTGGLVNDPQYAVINDGYVTALRENNGVTGNGLINYKQMPTTFRANMTSEEKRTYAPAQSDLQAHATCSGVAALASSANILAWQGNDPFYNYVPWQNTSAGIGDAPAKWIPVVKAATGVDLSTVTDFPAACTGLGGTYHAADATVTTVAAASSATVAAAVAPIQTQLDSLITAKGGVDAALATVQADATAAKTAAAVATAEVARLKLAATPLAFTLTGKHSPSQIAGSGLAVKLAGPATEKVRVRLLVSAAKAKALKLKSTVLATATTTLGADAAASLTLKPGSAAKKALKKATGSLPVSLEAVAGQRSITSKTTLSR